MADARNNHDVGDIAQRLGATEGMVVQELGWDDDADSRISEAIEDAIGDELLDEDSYELCDIILLWWRVEDGDLVDVLVDATRNLGPDGTIWLMSPGAGQPGTAEPGEINESAHLAGLVSTTAERFGDWQAAALVSRGNKK